MEHLSKEIPGQAPELPPASSSRGDPDELSKEKAKLRLAHAEAPQVIRSYEQDPKSREAAKLRLADAVAPQNESPDCNSRAKEGTKLRLADADAGGAEPTHHPTVEESMDGPDPEEPTLNAYTVEEEEEEEEEGKDIVTATILESEVWTRKRILLGAFAFVLVTAAISVAAVFGGTSSEPTVVEIINSTAEDTPTGNPTSSSIPTFSPTEAPSVFPLSWQLFGDFNNGGSDDDYGYSVSISSNGLVLAISAPSAGYVEVHKYQNSIWSLVTEWDSPTPPGTSFGESISMSIDGDVIAIGSPALDHPDRRFYGTPSWSGKVNVWHIAGDTLHPTYEALGQELVGEGIALGFGSSVSLSGDGIRLAVGYGNDTKAEIFELNEGMWSVIGTIQLNSSSTGTTVAISRDGRVVAVSTKKDSHVTIYRYQSADTWEQMGQQLRGISLHDLFGYSLEFANNGLTIAIGAPRDDGPNGPGSVPYGQTTRDPDLGAVRVYDFDESSSLWVQRGADLLGSQLFDYFGTSLSISHDGKSMVVGAIGGSFSGPNSGYARIFHYNAELREWLVVGQTINGLVPEGKFGTSVGISDDGDIVTVGSPQNDPEGTNFDSQGYIQTFITGVSKKDGGDVQVELGVIVSDSLDQGAVWIERLDLPTISNGPVVVEPTNEFSFSSVNQSDKQKMSIVLNLEMDGVYRVLIDSFARDTVCCDSITVSLLASNDTYPTDLLLRDEFFYGYTGYTFSPSKAVRRNKAGTDEKKLLLVLQIDSSPEEIHWVLKATWPSSDAVTGRPTWTSEVIDFNPVIAYGNSLAGSEINHVIDASRAPLGADCTLIVYNMGVEQNVSYRLYEGVDAVESSLAVQSDGQQSLRKVASSFTLTDTSLTGRTVPLVSPSPTPAPTEESAPGTSCAHAHGPLVVDGGHVNGTLFGSVVDFRAAATQVDGRCADGVNRGGVWHYVVGDGSTYRANVCGYQLGGFTILEGRCPLMGAGVNLTCLEDVYLFSWREDCDSFSWPTMKSSIYLIYVYQEPIFKPHPNPNPQPFNLTINREPLTTIAP